METNGNGTSTTSDSSGVCQKLFSAIASPAFRTIRQISFPARDPSPLENFNHAAGKKIIDIQRKPQQPNKSVDQVIRVPIKFEKTAIVLPDTPNENSKGKLSTTHKAAAKIEPEPSLLAQKRVIAIEHITHGQEGKKSKSKRSSSHVKGAAVGEAQQLLQAQKPGVVDMNDKFSDYIHRAKNKFKSSTSNVGK